MPVLTEAQLAMTLEELTADLVGLNNVKHQDIIDKAKTAWDDAKIAKDSAIEKVMRTLLTNVTEEKGKEHDPLIEEALQALTEAEKKAEKANATIEAPVIKGKSHNAKRHLSWTGPRFGIFVIQYMKDNKGASVPDIINAYEIYNSGPIAPSQIHNNLKVAGWTLKKVEEMLELTYDCTCCGDKDRPNRPKE